MRIEFKKGCITILRDIRVGDGFKYKAQVFVRATLGKHDSVLSVALHDDYMLAMNPQSGEIIPLQCDIEVTRLRAKMVVCMTDKDDGC